MRLVELACVLASVTIISGCGDGDTRTALRPYYAVDRGPDSTLIFAYQTNGAQPIDAVVYRTSGTRLFVGLRVQAPGGALPADRVTGCVRASLPKRAASLSISPQSPGVPAEEAEEARQLLASPQGTDDDCDKVEAIQADQ